MRKIVITFGLVAGAILSAMLLVTVQFQAQIGFERGELVGYTSMVLAFLMVVFGIRAYRDNVGGGSVSFGRAFQVGLLITLVASACYVATWQFVQHRLMPDFMDRYAAYEIDKARQAGATPAELAAKEKGIAEFKEMYRNPLFSIGMTFLEPLPVGVVFSLVAAGVLSRRRRSGAAAAG